MSAVTTAVSGAGLGLRRALLGPLADLQPGVVSFMEATPENWMNIGGSLGRQFRAYTERFPFVTHGLSLSIGSPEPLDEDFVRRLKTFLDLHSITDYSEHLTYCSDDGHLYDLMPIPFTEEAVEYVAARVRRVQDILERRIALENASYYAVLGTSAGDPRSSSIAPTVALPASAGDPGSSSITPALALGDSFDSNAAVAQPLSEIEFIRAVLDRAGCDLLLDVNNIYVNSINHRYDPLQFLDRLPGERVRYIHIAGHYEEAEDLRVDTHGSDVIAPVWQLLDRAYRNFGVIPTLLERDFNIPPVAELLAEVAQINRLQQKHGALPLAANG